MKLDEFDLKLFPLLQFAEGIRVTDNYDEIGEAQFTQLALDAYAVFKRSQQTEIDK